jgi:hypothetical protein
MSQLYRFNIQVDYIPQDLVLRVKRAIAEQYGFSEASTFSTIEDEDTGWSLEVEKELSLSGVADEDYALEICVAIWSAAGMYVEVTVHTVYLENLPTEVYLFEEDEYDEWKEKNG